jgi:xylan 1,4-beta-xylosidase
MGSPKQPDAAQIVALEKAGQLQLLHAPEWIKTKNGETVVRTLLPRQGVSLLKFSW